MSKACYNCGHAHADCGEFGAVLSRLATAEAEADRLRLKAIEDALRINNLLRETARLEDVAVRMQQRAVAAARVLDVDTGI